MIIPIKCFTCGTVIADKYQYYCQRVRAIKVEKKEPINKTIYLTQNVILIITSSK